jgi:acetylornithine deacetylase
MEAKLNARHIHPLWIGRAVPHRSVVLGVQSSGPRFGSADEVHIWGSIGLIPGDDPASVKELLEAELDQLLGESALEWRLEWRAAVEPAETDASHPLVMGLSSALWQTGIDLEIRALDGASDLRTVIGAGIPAIHFGPGSIDAAHAPNESISRDSLDSAIAAAGRFVLDWCTTPVD